MLLYTIGMGRIVIGGMKMGINHDYLSALLSEYQVCEQDNIANFQGYWTLSAIFIGISTTLLGGLVYTIVTSNDLLNIIISHNSTKVFIIAIICLVVGLAMVIVLLKLYGWHWRIKQNQTINSSRMREIELDLKLGFSRSWRLFALDEWFTIPIKERSRESLAKKLKIRLNPMYHNRLDLLMAEIYQFVNLYTEQGHIEKINFKQSSSINHYPIIIKTIIGLWILEIVGTIFIIFLTLVTLTSNMQGQELSYFGNLLLMHRLGLVFELIGFLIIGVVVSIFLTYKLCIGTGFETVLRTIKEKLNSVLLKTHKKLFIWFTEADRLTMLTLIFGTILYFVGLLLKAISEWNQ
jgi:hypothetical protein